MARINTIRMAPILNPQNDVGAFAASLNYTIPNAAAESGDRITLLQMERDGIIFSGQFAVGGTLGASCTVQLQHSNGADDVHTSLTGATTAGGADREQLTRAIRFKKGDTISLLVGGATVGAAAALELDLLVAHDPVLNART
jgi:hypothetical protein